MKALLYKDWIAMKKPLSFLVVLIVAISLINQLRSPSLFLIPGLFLLIPLIVLGVAFGVDQESRVDQYIVAAPVARRTIVLSRYVLAWGLIALGTLLSSAHFLIAEAQGNDLGLPWPLLVPGLLLLLSLIPSIQLPLSYRFGLERARLVFLLLYFVLLSSFSVLGSHKAELEEGLAALRQFPTAGISLLLLALAIGINGLSLAISTRVYTAKEF